MANMFQQAKQVLEMRSQMKKLQKKLAEMTFHYANAGVDVTVNGDLQIVKLELTEESFVDRERLQRTLPENINKALRLARDGVAKEMASQTDMMGGLSSLLGGKE